MSDISTTSPIPSSAIYRPGSIKRFRRTKAAITSIKDSIFEILEKDNPQTVRQVFYALTVRGVIKKDEGEYHQTIVRLLTEMRETERIPFEWITDSTRLMRKPASFTNLKSCLESTANFYRRNVWSNMPVYVEVWVEKDALSGVLVTETEVYDVPLMSARGYSSITFLHSAAKAIKAKNKPAYIYHFGDLDPSGVDAARDIEAKLRRYAPGAEIHFERPAVTREQVEQWDLPTRPTKMTDTRAKNNMPVYVEVWVEKDALSGVLVTETEVYDVPLMSARGYSSITFLHSAAKAIKAKNKPAYIYHFGDLDPSGVDAARDIEAKLRRYAPGAEIHFERPAVTREQVEQWDLPTRPTKMTDTRAKNNMPVYVEVWVEKDALSGVLVTETEVYDVPLMSARGYSSITFLHSAAKAIKAKNKPAYIYHFGDLDPSGVDAARDIEAKLRRYAPGAEIHFERPAVTREQVEQWDLPTRPTKMTDTRAKKFIGTSVELDTIPAAKLRELVRGCIEQHIDQKNYEHTKIQEASEREFLVKWTELMKGGAA